MIFEQLNPGACRSYLIASDGDTEAFIIDPVLEHVDDYLKLLKEKKLHLACVIDTHTHADHISGAAALKDRTGCDYMMHTKAPALCPGTRLSHGAKFNIGKIPVKVIHTPGHTKDSISLVLPEIILTGDALFLDDGGAGRDDLPGGDPAEHWESLQRIAAQPESLIVFPAHEYRNRKPSSLGKQKKTNPHLKPRTKLEFIKYIEDLRLGPAEWMKDVLKANYACAQNPKAAWIPADTHACEVKGTMAAGANAQIVKPISAHKLEKKLSAADKPFLLDVREPAELEGELGHLPDITNIPIGSLAGRLGELEKYRGKEIVTVCRSGGRAHTAAQILMQAGFENVTVLEGGMLGWRKEENN